MTRRTATEDEREEIKKVLKVKNTASFHLEYSYSVQRKKHIWFIIFGARFEFTFLAPNRFNFNLALIFSME